MHLFGQCLVADGGIVLQSIEQLQINDVEFQFSQNFVHLEIIFQMIKMKKFNFINLKK